MEPNTEDLLSFLKAAPTAWHACEQIGARLTQHNYLSLEEGHKWNLQPGVSYFTKRGGALCAFTLPQKAPKHITLLASHTDSPALKLKPHPIFIENTLPFLRVETYGGPILSSWMNRDLIIAGRVWVSQNNGEIKSQLVSLEKTPLLIPSLAIHLDRHTNESPTKIDKQEHLCPLVGLNKNPQTPKQLFEELLRSEVAFDNLLGFDLFLVPHDEPRLLGIDRALLGSYRLDNLVSAHASLLTLEHIKTIPEDTLQMAIFWNHEEIGSNTDEGANSPFLHDVLKRICLSYKMAEEDFIRIHQTSYLVSIDMAHALHPNYKKKYDLQNAPSLGKGIAIKYNANQRYATNGFTASRLVQLCQKHTIPYQSFASESNLPSGSTVGSFAATKMGIPTIDIGIPQLSMHSAREVIAVEDHLQLCKLLSTIFDDPSFH